MTPIKDSADCDGNLHNDQKLDKNEAKNILSLIQNSKLNKFLYKKPDPSEKRNYDLDSSENLECILNAANYHLNKSFRMFDQIFHFKNNINWHYDILKSTSIPKKFWNKINYRNPNIISDIKYLWELNRHQHFITLGKAYYLTDDEKYASELFDQWLNWIKENPPLVGLNWASPLELAFRIISWTWALRFTIKSKLLDEKILTAILKSIHCHAEHILKYHSRFSSANNHLIGEVLGLIYAGVFFSFFYKSSKWLATGISILDRELYKQTFASGVNREQSSYYHWYVLEFYLLTSHALKCAGDSSYTRWLPMISKMAEYLKHIVLCNGQLVLLGDEDGGQAILLSEIREDRFKATLNLAAEICDRPDLDFDDNKKYELSYWLGATNTKQIINNSKQEKNDIKIKIYKDAGIIIHTDNRDKMERKAIFRCGPLGYGNLSAHGHADALSFLLYIDGNPLLVDPGTYTYYSDPYWRNYFRSTRAHNTVTVDECDQSEMLGPFIWGKKATARIEKIKNSSSDQLFRARASHDGYLRFKSPILHKRTVVYPERNIWIIHDVLEGVGEHLFRLHWQLPYKDIQLNNYCDGDIEYSEIWSSNVTSFFFKMKIEGGNCRVEPGWLSPSFGVKKQMSSLVCERKCFAPQQFITVINLFNDKITMDQAKKILNEIN